MTLNMFDKTFKIGISVHVFKKEKFFEIHLHCNYWESFKNTHINTFEVIFGIYSELVIVFSLTWEPLCTCM